MKMLGQDVLTQEEFDTHMMGEFRPLSTEVADLRSEMLFLKILSFSSLVVSLISLSMVVYTYLK